MGQVVLPQCATVLVGDHRRIVPILLRRTCYFVVREVSWNFITNHSRPLCWNQLTVAILTLRYYLGNNSN